MPVDLTIAGAMGLKAVAAAKAAAAASKQAAAQAIAMAQNTNLAALQAEQAQANLEKYVYGVPVSSVPPVVAPMPPAASHPFPAIHASIPGLMAALPPPPDEVLRCRSLQQLGTTTSCAARRPATSRCDSAARRRGFGRPLRAAEAPGGARPQAEKTRRSFDDFL
eukprot:TRINITY_DN25530_c0_g1_i1.p1 TRINITY_DN25530_c0_g1~~TRINITY_DN25530_c0_g1_i1.p1  ORF type:complete len:186 (-),score=40.74 TRINITY_DN25530_c0_g1_i1:28-522(-)